jgi:hypothetical protein
MDRRRHGRAWGPARNRGHRNLRDTLEEARAFLGEPSHFAPRFREPLPRNTAKAARRLFAASRPVRGTLAETYLHSRGVTVPLRFPSLRFHPACYYREHDGAPPETWPALIAAVTDLSGNITGVHRTWLARDGSAKAPIEHPRRAMGHLLGHAVRLGAADDVLAAGEGIETMLSLKSVLPDIPMTAALSAAHLAALSLPNSLRRLYVAVDNDPAGRRAARRLTARARETNIEAHFLVPRGKDWNADLHKGRPATTLIAALAQLSTEDATRFAAISRSATTT